MDTTVADEVHSQYAEALQQLQQENGTRLVDPSFVLLRIVNNGATHIDTNDYAVLDEDKVGIRVGFPGRKVAGMVVTELSDHFLCPCFSKDSGLRARDDVIELPKVPLNRSRTTRSWQPSCAPLRMAVGNGSRSPRSSAASRAESEAEE